jgi:hypothetical protein
LCVGSVGVLLVFFGLMFRATMIFLLLAHLTHFHSFVESTIIDLTYQICTLPTAETTASIALAFEGVLGETSLTAPSKGFQNTISIDLGSLDPSQVTISFTMSTSSSDGVCFSHFAIDDAIVFEETMWFDNPCDGSVHPCFSSKTFLFRSVPFIYRACSESSDSALSMQVANLPVVPIYGQPIGSLIATVVNIGDSDPYQELNLNIHSQNSDGMCLDLIKISGVSPDVV